MKGKFPSWLYRYLTKGRVLAVKVGGSCNHKEITITITTLVTTINNEAFYKAGCPNYIRFLMGFP